MPPDSHSNAPGRTRGRLAPSPTGRLHLGHARSFLAAWWSARSVGGEIILRIEDLDRLRCTAEFDSDLLRDLEWLGLDWEGPVLRQTDDLAPYEDAVQSLLERDLAYACTCSRAAIIGAQSAPHAGGSELRYPGTCSGRWTTPAAAEASSGRPAGVRFRVPTGEQELMDGFAGRHAGCPQDECGDFLLLRRDGVIAYQLAVVVDDARQGITEVVRGDDLLPSTPRQAQLQDALGLPRPAWFHPPMVQDRSGRRLAKRDGDRELAELRSAGVDPRRIVEWAAATLGLPEARETGASSAGELCAALAPAFRWATVPRAPVRTDPAELQ